MSLSDGKCDCGCTFCTGPVERGGRMWCRNCLWREVERLQAIVDKLLKTADGVPVVLKMVLWILTNDAPFANSGEPWPIQVVSLVLDDGSACIVGRALIEHECEYDEARAKAADCYSTQEAEEVAAVKAGGDA